MGFSLEVFRVNSESIIIFFVGVGGFWLVFRRLFEGFSIFYRGVYGVEGEVRIEGVESGDLYVFFYVDFKFWEGVVEG